MEKRPKRKSFPSSKNNFKKAKNKAWKFYNKWRGGKTYCPALNSEVRISLKGWRHITGATGAKKRSSKDVLRRLKLLPYAKELIKKSTTIQDISKEGNKTYYVLEAISTIRDAKSGKNKIRKVRVILIEDKKENKILYSVMDKKIRRN